jgi:cyclohexa-1,5-dienecarbonyl-CoA hydratase
MAAEAAAVNLATLDGVAQITLNNPPVNILTGAMMDGVSDALEKAAADASLKAVAFTAQGKAFSAGADIGEHRPENVRDMIASFGRMFRLLDALELPVVMAVDGAALGAGFELVMMADVLLASERATFGQPEIRLGFFAPVGMVELPALLGRAKAMEITCSGRTYSAAEMHECGLVTKVLPAGDLEEALKSILDDFRKASPFVMRMNTRTLKRLRGRPFGEALSTAEKVFLDELMAAEDPREGIAAFYEKRRPAWKNR